jgi:hypothetical protein
VGYRADSGTQGQQTNLNCHTPLREELTKQLLLKEEKKQTLPSQFYLVSPTFCGTPGNDFDHGGQVHAFAWNLGR